MHMVKRILLGLIAIVVFAIPAFGLFPSINTAQAAPNFNNDADVILHEKIAVFIERCAGGRMPDEHNGIGVRLAGEMSTERASKGEIFHAEDGVNHTFTGQHEVRMSHIIGGKIACENSSLSGDAIRALYGSLDAFISKYYEGDPNDGNRLNRKAIWGGTNRENTGAMLGELRRDAVAKGYYVVKNGGQYPTDAMVIRYRVLRPMFEACFEPQTTVTDPNFIVTSPNAGSNKFQIRAGKDEAKVYPGLFFGGSLSGSGMSADTGGIGAIIDPSGLLPDKQAGGVNCLIFASVIRGNANYYREVFKSVDERNQEIVDSSNEQKVREITTEIAGNRQILLDCITFSATDDLKANPSWQYMMLPDVAYGLDTPAAQWLVDNYESDTKEPFRIADGHGGSFIMVGANQAEAFWKCLVGPDGYGTAVTDILEIDPILIDPVNDADSTAPEATCENSNGSLGFIMCPFIDAVAGMLNWVDTQIQALLATNRDSYASDSLYKVWAGFRNIGFAILIIMMLVMVIGTALGGQIFDAYTVKRALPRMVAAIIFISLSWYIVVAMVDLSIIVGNGVLGIMTSPFPQAQSGDVTLSSLFSSGAAATAGGAVIVGGIGVGALAALSVIPGLGPILLSYLGTAALVVLLAFLVLTLRNMFIIVLMLFSPLAILAWIFPSNDKMWKLWWGTFTKLLMMFPLIMALIAAGRIFSLTVDITDDGVVPFIIKVSAFVLPYAMIPMTFKFAGGAFASLAGMVNDRSKGGFDRLKKGRAKNVDAMKKRAAAGDLAKGITIGNRTYGANSRLTRGLNRVAGGASAGWAGRYGFGARGAGHHDTHFRDGVEEAIKSNGALRQLGYSDDAIAVMALSGGTEEGALEALEALATADPDPDNHWTEERRRRALGSARAVGIDRTNAAAAMTIMAQNKSRALSGPLTGDAGMNLVRRSAQNLSEGNEDLAENLMGGFAFHSRNAGREDLGGEMQGESAAQGWTRTSIGQQMQSFGASFEHFAGEFVEDIEHGSPEEKVAAAIALSEMANNLPAATAENQAHVIAALSALGVDPDMTRTQTTTQRQVVPDGQGGHTVVDVPVSSEVRVSVEEQLASLANWGTTTPPPPGTHGPTLISAQQISARARQYGAAQPLEERGGPPQPPNPNPGPIP